MQVLRRGERVGQAVHDLGAIPDEAAQALLRATNCPVDGDGPRDLAFAPTQLRGQGSPRRLRLAFGGSQASFELGADPLRDQVHEILLRRGEMPVARAVTSDSNRSAQIGGEAEWGAFGVGQRRRFADALDAQWPASAQRPVAPGIFQQVDVAGGDSEGFRGVNREDFVSLTLDAGNDPDFEFETRTADIQELVELLVERQIPTHGELAQGAHCLHAVPMVGLGAIPFGEASPQSQQHENDFTN